MDDVAFVEYFAGLSIGLIVFVVATVMARNRWRSRLQWRHKPGRLE